MQLNKRGHLHHRHELLDVVDEDAIEEALIALLKMNKSNIKMRVKLKISRNKRTEIIDVDLVRKLNF